MSLYGLLTRRFNDVGELYEEDAPPPMIEEIFEAPSEDETVIQKKPYISELPFVSLQLKVHHELVELQAVNRRSDQLTHIKRPQKYLIIDHPLMKTGKY